MSQHKLAKILDLKQPTVSMILSGDRGISINTAKKISEITGKPWTMYIDMSLWKVNDVLKRILRMKRYEEE